MTKHEIFEVWAPPGGIWSDWVKPVLFARMQSEVEYVADPPRLPSDPQIRYEQESALVIDLPGALGVEVGIIAAKNGYRPVPLYNALPAPNENPLGLTGATVPGITGVMYSLAAATPVLSSLSLPSAAPAAFLLDANRRGGMGKPRPGMFDNRSVSFTTDFPSATYLSVQGISKVYLVQETGAAPQPDLAHTLLKWQENGIQIFAKTLMNPEVLEPLRIARPSHFGRIWYRVLLALGLQSDRLGGFGGIVPDPSSG
jgi:hypothetical protein